MNRRFLLLASLAIPLASCSDRPHRLHLDEWSKVQLTKPFYNDENVDFGVAKSNAIHLADLDGPTPTEIDGARTITTVELHDMLLAGTHMTLIDVLDGLQKVSLPNTYWIPEAGLGASLHDSLQKKFAAGLADLTNGDKNRPVVIFCVSQLSWLSHNAVVRAVSLGYTNVLWYRGGANAWITAGLSVQPVLKISLNDYE